MLNCSVVYVDPGITMAGDGQSPTSALAALPEPGTLAADTVYLIRRTATPLTWGTGLSAVNVDQANIYFIGMPKPDDWLWPATPQIARDAWGADTPDHADLKFGNHALSVRFRHISGNGGVHRLRFLVPNLSSVTSNANFGFLCWTNANHSGGSYEQKYDKAVFMTDCDWRVEGVNLDDPACVEICQRTINSWFSCYFCKSVDVRGCRFVYPGQQDSTSFYSHIPFYFNSCQRASMMDCDCWIGAYGENRAHQPLCYFDAVADVTFTDNRNRYVIPQGAGRDAYLRGWLYIGGSNTRRVERVSSRVERFYTPESLPNRLVMHREVIRCQTGYTHVGYDQTRNKPTVFDADIDVDMTPCWECHDSDYNPDSNSGSSVVYLNGDNGSNDMTTQFSEGYIRDIRVVVPRAGGIGRANIPYALYMDYPNAQHLGRTLTGLDVRNYRGGALRIEGSTNGSYQGRSGLPPLELGRLEGGIYLRNCGLVTVEQLDVGRPDRFLYVEGTTAYFDRIVAPAEAWNNHNILQNANHSRLVINRINVPVLWLSGMVFNGQTGIIVNSDSGVDGRWKARNAYYQGENWNARREGGAISSLRLWGTTDVRLPLKVGFHGFRNFRVAAPAAGRYLLRMHGAHKLFAAETLPFLSRRVVVKAAVRTVVGVDAGDAPIVATRQFESQSHGWWEADPTAVWHNDDGLTPVACVIPVDIPNTGNAVDRIIDVRVEYDWYDQQGYFYLDPLPVLEAL